jgi:hypothetical protein
MQTVIHFLNAAKPSSSLLLHAASTASIIFALQKEKERKEEKKTRMENISLRYAPASVRNIDYRSINEKMIGFRCPPVK